MCTPLPEWEIPADWQPQPIIFRKASFNQPEYKFAPYRNAFSEPQEWNLEQRSQDSDNDGDMFSLIGSSPADSNKHGQAENEEVETLEAPHLVGKSKNIHDIKSHQSCSEFEDLPHLSVLEHRFTSYRPILACNSSGWYGKFSSCTKIRYLELIFNSSSVLIFRDPPPSPVSGSCR